VIFYPFLFLWSWEGIITSCMIRMAFKYSGERKPRSLKKVEFLKGF